MSKYVITKTTDDVKRYRTFSGAWVEIKGKKTQYPLKSYVDINNAEIGKNYIEHKEGLDNLVIEELNINKWGK
tara:strand:+ start:407 stop:625 length:219 start_codon:yes stop_codon:yes gene_type:complete